MPLFGRSSNVETLQEKGDVKRLVKLLAHDDSGTRGRAVEALRALAGRGDAAASESLIAALGSEHEEVQWGAARMLRELGNTAAVAPYTARLIGGEHDYERAGAAEALRELGDARAVEPLITALGDRSEHVRENASRALGELGDARAVEPLIAALRDEHMDVLS